MIDNMYGIICIHKEKVYTLYMNNQHEHKTYQSLLLLLLLFEDISI